MFSTVLAESHIARTKKKQDQGKLRRLKLCMSMCRILIIRGNSEAVLQWDARVLWVFAWAIITLTHHVLGKCRQYSAVQRRDGWCVCRHCWTVDPIISWGRKGGARHHRREIKDDWLNQNRGPSWTACASIIGKPWWEPMQQLCDGRELSQEVRRSSVTPSWSEVGEESSCGEKNFQSLRISPRHVGTPLQLRSGGSNHNKEEYFTPVSW